MTKKRFESFDKEFQLLADTLPMLVSVTKNPDDETEEQFIATHDHFIELDEITKNKLATSETASEIQAIGKNCNLKLVQMSDIARAIRSYYFGELTLEDMPFYLAKEIPIDLSKAKEISQIIIQKIINDDSQEKAYQSQLEKLPIDVAVKRYPELGEQLVTSDYIKLKSFFEPVRPSIKNWLSDYTFNIGISNHDPVVRGNYLFKNENAQKLSQQDRDKLSQILKSFEEKTPLAVNTNTRQVVFSAMANQEKTQTFQTDEERLSAWRKNLPLKETLENKNNNQPETNNIRFSSPQKFSTEKPQMISPKYSSPRPMPKNVVDLREE